MEVTITTERDLATEAAKHGVRFSTTATNEQVATALLRRQLTRAQTRTNPIPNPYLRPLEITNRDSYPEIIWESMSCYLDSIVNLLLRPEMESVLWLTVTYKQHPVQGFCRGSVERVRDTWRESIFALLEKKRISLRPFLQTLQDCEDFISPDTPFWTTCLNDPMEFIHNAFVPILSVDSHKILQEHYRERMEYVTVAGQGAVDPVTKGDAKAADTVELQVLHMNVSEIENGRWLASPDTFYTVVTEFQRDPPVFITKDTWEYNGLRRMFIQNKGKPEEREVPLTARTDDIGSQITRRTNTITPFHSNAKVIMIGLQSDDQNRLEEIPFTIEKGTSKWKLMGAIVFSRRHYTSVFYDASADQWIHYDTMSLPQQKSKDEVKRIILTKGRCVVYSSSRA